MYALIQGIILGIVEGLTEFLPVSSTGHLIIAQRAIHFNDVGELFTVVVQIGAIAAVVWYFRRDLTMRIRALMRREPAAIRFWTLLAIATGPALVLGLVLNKVMEHISVPSVIAWALIVGGVVILLVDRAPVPQKTQLPALERITPRQAWLVGLGQCLALVPGVSRSGATIISGVAAGMDRPTATAFSFYLSIPVLVLASGYKLLLHGDELAHISGGLPALLAGIVAAFITALIAIAWLLRFVAHHNFRPFAYYRIAFGIIILLVL